MIGVKFSYWRMYRLYKVKVKGLGKFVILDVFVVGIKVMAIFVLLVVELTN